MADEEQRLVDAGRNGDIDAFNQLVVIYQNRVYTTCTRILGDSESGADATQDTFLSAYRNLHRFRGGSFRAWIMRIATNTCYDVLRARKRRPALSLDAPIDTSEGQVFLDPPDPGESPDTVAERHELAALIQEGLLTLPEDQRIAIVLCDIQGMNYNDIAEMTRCNLGTIKSRLSRGRARLRDFLKSREQLPARYRHGTTNSEETD